VGDLIAKAIAKVGKNGVVTVKDGKTLSGPSHCHPSPDLGPPLELTLFCFQDYILIRDSDILGKFVKATSE
jgi:hypothetical protein